ncbi:ectonucleotide pyrophosphatase/phosphodiesterase [Fodinibius halophilus]|uniref:Alkaline phosphatase family protein n=1 Tax=Fodinibius halophilus TaxID=1736908 RepID=A0A6M1TJ83_9BACT|nr:ectonucleotide pyrophosphatase/phosphodiesterase [Fodinibius halophilus]NGP88680.1 alkaline phosphatase family protein [Fodinibius halophilus]
MKRRLLTILLLAVCTGLLGCSSEQQPNPPKTLLISFDGFGHNYLHKADTPNFDTLAAGGVQAEGLIPVFPTKTFPNHYSIATGLYPENTGFIGNTMYDPKWEEWYRIRDREAVENGKWYGGEPIWNTLEKQGIKTGTMFWVGSEADIQGMRPTHWKRYNDDMPGKARIDTVIKWMAAPGDRVVNFATLYYSDVDSKGHRYGTKSDSVKQAIKRADRLMGYLKQQMEKSSLWENTNIIIVSDHGMVNQSADKLIRLDNIINMENTGRVIWGPMTMIEPKNGKKEEVYRGLKSAENNYKVYKKEDLPERYHLKNHRRVEDIVMVAELGYTILDEEYEQRFLNSLPRATHGYDNNNKEMQALFLARGPAFKSGAEVEAFQNIHIYELINHLMGTEPTQNDGSVDSVRVLLN